MARSTGLSRRERQAELRRKNRKAASAARTSGQGTTSKARSRAENRRSSSSSSLRTIPASKRPADMRRGVTYGDAGRPYKGPGGNPNGSGQGQAQQAPPAPKLPPRSTVKTAPTKPTKPTKATKPTKPTTSTKTTPAKRKPRTWLAENYKAGKGPARRSTSGNASNKPKQSARMAKALKNLKVRKY